jgi:fumarate reductase subunit D
MIRPHRSHPLWLAYFLHRVSGLLLALFLPTHFYALSLVLTNPDYADSLLRLTDHPLVKLAEGGLVFLLAVHFFGGLRLLAFEFLPWSGRRKTLAAGAIAFAFFVSCSFVLRAV